MDARIKSAHDGGWLTMAQIPQSDPSPQAQTGAVRRWLPVRLLYASAPPRAAPGSMPWR